MLLDCVLTAVNENELYIDFIPLFIKAWKKLYPDVDIKIILIANNIPKKFKEYIDYIILFKPIINVSSSFTSQYIRLLYPCILNYRNGILITDIDIIPMNRKYYTENILNYSNDKFIYYRENICFNYNQIAMCYNIATPKIWSNIFNINSLQDIYERLNDVYKNINYIEGHGNYGWCTDQIHLYKYVIEWNKKTKNFICLKEKNTKFKRLDRHTFTFPLSEEIKQKIKNGIYTDYHCLRPNIKYNNINNIIIDLL